ncbi:MAG TPA: flagellar motor protein MotB [Steroidobacteraceae bacterium]|nr:flagellar motor protein MotB [Steroidobacteraceae bacterium]
MAANPKGGGDEKAAPRPIYIKRVKKVAGGHHGGAWKVAYADFVTAMMAFFLVMWLVTAVSKEQRAAIFDYFKNPSMEPGKSVKPAPGQMGPGGASTSVINLGGGLDAPKSSMKKTDKIGATVMTEPAKPIDLKSEAQKVEELKKEIEKKQLDALMQDLKEAIAKSQALEPFKDQLLLDITPEGLRIQIVDAQNRPMFDLGSSHLKSYTTSILKEVTQYLKTVPNRISITGHTDTTPYAGVSGYTNWDLSTDRANAARRAIEGAGYDTLQISRVTGLGSSVLFDKQNPRNPVNRRISIVVMTQAAEERAQRIDIPTTGSADEVAKAAEEALLAAEHGGKAPAGEPSGGDAPAPNIPMPSPTGASAGSTVVVPAAGSPPAASANKPATGATPAPASKPATSAATPPPKPAAAH